MTRLLSVGDVARILGVPGRRVKKWIDQGLLAGFRLPGERYRRIQLEALLRFATDHGLERVELASLAAAAGLVPAMPTLLLVGTGPLMMRWYALAGWDPALAEGTHRAVELLAHRSFQAALVDGAVGLGVAREFALWARDRRPGLVIGLLVPEDVHPSVEDLAPALTWKKPADLDVVAASISAAIQAAQGGRPA